MAFERQKTEVIGNTEAVDELVSRALHPATVEGLDPKKAKALAALLECSTQKEAAKQAGISERTMRTYLDDRTFSELLSRCTSQLVSDSQRRAARMLGRAFDKLDEELDDLLPIDSTIAIVRLLVDTVSKLG